MKINWGKFVLIFQAVITLIIGIIFFLQFINLATSKITRLNEIDPLKRDSAKEDSFLKELEEMESRYKLSSYIIVIVSLIELIILTRIFN